MKIHHLLVGCLGAFALLFPAAAAQNAAPGTITGRIMLAATGEYVRDAQISVVGTENTAVSEAEGSYRIGNVPAGEVTLAVTYTGFAAEPRKVRVVAGQIAVQDFTLVSTLGRAAKDEAIQLGAFEVTSAREGDAKAIMQQRSAMNITTTVATDAFGQVGDQNIAEFLKNLAGVDAIRVAGGIRNVALRGLPAEYTNVNVDGMSPAVADANTGAAGNARAISFEQLSLSSIESVEIAKTVSADQDANAPAGTISLRMKRAFDTRGRRIAWELNTTAFSETFSLQRSLGPDEVHRRRLFPGGSLSYSDVLLGKRLGLALNLTNANTYSEINRALLGYNFTATAADPRPVVSNTISLVHGQRLFGRTGASLTADFKATPSLVLSLGILYNYLDQWSPQSTVAFNTGGRTAVRGADPVVDFTASGSSTNVSVNYQGISKIGRTTSYLPRFEYRLGALKLEGKLGYSDATSFYNPLSEHNAINTFGNPTLSGVAYRVTRSAFTRADFAITQISGPDWNRGTSFTSPSITADDGRYQRTRTYSGQLDASMQSRWRLPIEWKAGVKALRNAIRFDVTTAWNIFDYTGPGRGVGAWAPYQSPYAATLGQFGATVTSSSGLPVFYPYLTAVGALVRAHPEYFTQVASAANFNTAFVANHKDFTEDVRAGYLMGTTRLGRLQLRAGLRREDTFIDSLEFDPQRPSAMAAAGYALATTGLATTVPGVQYQYFSKPKVHRTSDYSDYFPSAAAKYKLSSNLEAQVGYSKTIRRPTFRDIAGVFVINQQAHTVSVPNTGLKPERSDNYSTRLAYYFEPVGMVAINLFQNTVKGLHTSSRLTAQQYGYVGQDLLDYTFITATQSADETIVRGMEVEYRQSLSFLPAPFRGLSVRANYSRNYAQVTYPSMAPHRIAGGLTYALGRIGVYTNLNWTADTPTSSDGNNFTRHRLDADMGGAYQLTTRMSLFFTAKNILRTDGVQMTNRNTGPAVATTIEAWGTEWVLGFKGAF